MLSNGTHYNPILQAAWHKYGPDAFAFNILVVLGPSDQLPTEQRLLDYMRQTGEQSYNISHDALAPMKGRRASQTTLEKKRGKIVSKQTRAKIRSARLGQPTSQETRARMSAAQRGRVVSEATRWLIRAARRRQVVWNKGKPVSEQERARLRSLAIGNKFRLGIKHSPETIAKLRAARIGKSLTKEHKDKIRASLLKRNAQVAIAS